MPVYKINPFLISLKPIYLTYEVHRDKHGEHRDVRIINFTAILRGIQTQE